jgi:tRNA pseudouridine32 synthase/23S rRNA pseudouridine746 synthase
LLEGDFDRVLARIAEEVKNYALSLYRLQPVTGRKHQLRVHLAALGIAIVNDAFYPDLRACKADDMTQPLQLLARAIAFIDPIDGSRRHFESLRTLSPI